MSKYQTIVITAFADESNDLTGETAVQIEGGIQLLSTLPKAVKHIIRSLTMKIDEMKPGSSEELRKIVIDQIILEMESIR